MTQPTISATLETVRQRKREATQRLLGDTIGISDADWREPSRLPGWTRAHVAAHLTANAHAFADFVGAVLEGRNQPLYPDQDERFRAIEQGARQSGLDLQIGLDQSAGRLNRQLDRVTAWDTPIRLLGRDLTLAQVPLARLSEVILHHVDLGCGYEVSAVEPVPARWLLQWNLFLHHDSEALPPLAVESLSGIAGDVGSGPDRRPVTGPDSALWGWLTGRSGGELLQGAEGVTPPLQH